MERVKRWPQGAATCLLYVALFSCTFDATHAQEPIPGSRVRVEATRPGRSAGLLLAATRDSLLMAFSHLPNGPIAIARHNITSFELSSGGNGAHSAAIGAQVGLVSGGILTGIYHLASRMPPPRYRYDRGDLIAAALSGAAVGAVMGGLVGGLAGRERWDSAALPLASAVHLPPVERRLVMQTRTRLDLFSADELIRVRTVDGRQVAGRFSGTDDSFLHIAVDSALRLPLSSIASIDERRAVTGRWLWRGMLAGAVIGLATVGVAALTDDGSCMASEACSQPWGPTALMFGAGGAFTGATVGAIAGSYVEEWRPQKW